MVIGECYFVESVTSHYYVGRVVDIHGPHTCTLEECAWVENTGRLGAFMRRGTTPEMALEFIGNRTVHWASNAKWPHKLFTEDV